MSKLSDSWETPQTLFNELNQEFNFDIDLCATETNKKVEEFSHDIFIQPKSRLINGVKVCYTAGFMNPPYSNPKPYIKRALEISQEFTVVCLVKADPSTSWWGLFWDYTNHKPINGVEVRFLPRRIKFDPPKGFTGVATASAFPSAIVIMRKS